MVFKIVGTTFSRGLIAITGLFTLILNTRYLGAEKLGELAIYLIVIHVAVQLSEFIGGPSLVYLQGMYSKNLLLKFSYLWALTVSLLAFSCAKFFESYLNLPFQYITLALFLQSINHVHLHYLVGREKIGRYNTSSMVFSIALLTGLYFAYVIEKETAVLNYVYAFIIAQIAMLVVSTWFVYNIQPKRNLNNSASLFLREALNYGALIQTTNLFQFGVYRLNYLILQSFTSFANLGVYALGNQLSEKALIPGNAISVVQYSSIANAKNKLQAITLTLRLISLSIGLTVISVCALVLIPESWILELFGVEFGAIKSVFYILSPGILFLSISTIYSHYFAGLGLYKYNMWVSAIGLLVSVSLSFALIPLLDMKGAATATSLVFFVQVIIQFFLFKSETKMSLSEIIIGHKQTLSFYLSKLKFN